MSDLATGGAGAPSSSSGEIVRGNGHAPGQGLGEAMPDVPQNVQRASLSEFKRVIAARAAAAKQPPAARGRVAEFSAKIEAKQQAPVQPNEPRGQVGQPPKAESQGDPNQLKDNPTAPGTVEDQSGTVEESGSEQQSTEESGETETALSDLDALRRFREWEQNDMFPDELEGKLHELKANGVTRYVDTKELKQGYIRGIDYHRMGVEVKQVQQQHQQYQQRMQQHFEQIRDPGQMLEIYERNGYGETLYGLAQLIAERDREDRGIVRAAGIDIMQRKGITDPNHREVVDAMRRAEERVKAMRKADIDGRRVAFERQQLEQERAQAQSAQKTKEHYATYENQLNQLRPLVFRAFGLPDNKANRAGLIKHLTAVVNSQDGMPPEGLTRDLLMAAGRDLAEELEAERASGGRPVGLSPEQWQRIQAQQQQRPNASNTRALPAQRLGTGGGGKPLAGAQSQQRGRLSDLIALNKRGRMGGV